MRADFSVIRLCFNHRIFAFGLRVIRLVRFCATYAESMVDACTVLLIELNQTIMNVDCINVFIRNRRH